jgi:bifunctional UDP-N-acetylglucosamine pyrophosphorylase/glucosamine-1-phosphate N-acetyltransferase
MPVPLARWSAWRKTAWKKRKEQSMTTQLVILAAGEGTRMNSDVPKVLHEVGGLPLFAHAIASGTALDPERIVLVVGKGADAVRDVVARLPWEITVVEQAERLGTGHAVQTAIPALKDAGGDTIVLFGDTPFVRPETLQRMTKARRDGHAVVVLGFEPPDPLRYGRLVMDGDILERIVEFKDATPEERKVTLCNGGVTLASTELMAELVGQLGDTNAAGEYYLTDIVALARQRGLPVTAVTCDPSETMGVDTREALTRAEANFQANKRTEMTEAGVTLIAPESVYLAYDTAIGRDAVVEPHVVFGPGVTVESGARIRAFSHLEGAHVGASAIVGPYARLRPGAELSNNVRIGNFVEVKNAALGDSAKVNHLSYVGDATVGARTNIGAGTVTCNYDGVSKHRTEIGEDAFIGSDTMLVAPVCVGDRAMTASGSVITRDVPADALAIARADQQTRPDFATRLMQKLRSAKAARKTRG